MVRTSPLGRNTTQLPCANEMHSFSASASHQAIRYDAPVGTRAPVRLGNMLRMAGGGYKQTGEAGTDRSRRYCMSTHSQPHIVMMMIMHVYKR